MPLRQASIPRQCELPILPFLAPRVFKPWPKGYLAYRTHGIVQATASQETICDDCIREVRSASARKSQRHGGPQARRIIVDAPSRKHQYWSPISTGDSPTKPIVAQVGKPKQWTDILRIRLASKRLSTPLGVKFNKVLLSGGSSSKTSIASSWSAAFAKLSWKYDEKLNTYPMPLEIRTLLDKQILKNLKSVREFLDIRTHGSVLERWPDLSLQRKEAVWPHLMLQTLERSPSTALKLLAATASKSYSPSYAISDSLEYIVCYYLFENRNPDHRDINTIFQEILRLLDHFEKDYFHLTQKTIYWVLINLEVDDAWLFYTTLNNNGNPLHENTLLHFVQRFARAGRTQFAIDVLRKIHGDGTDFNQPKLQSVCTALLQRKPPSNYKSILSDSEFFAFLLHLGLQPNIQIYTILVKNAIDDGDSETAWRIHDIMVENNVKPNEYTYSILLNDAKLRMDWPTVEAIMEIVRSDKIGDEHLITDLLHALYLHLEQEKKAAPTGPYPSSPFPRMLSLYCEYFDTGPINELLGESIYQKYVCESDGNKIRPSKWTLTVMFIALIRGFPSTQLTWSWYCHFRKLLLEGHPDAVMLVGSTRLYDAVIMSLGKVSATMQLCTIVVRDMLDSYDRAQEAIVSSLEPLASERNNDISTECMGRFTRSDQADWRSTPHGSITESDEGISDAEAHGGYSLDESLDDENPQSNSVASSKITFAHCQPSIRTWSILLNIFMDHNQPHAAEKVIKMMKSRQIEPNQVSWNSLALGYGRMQDISGIVGTIERLQKQGLKVDRVTMRALNLIRNKKALVLAMKEKEALLHRKASPTEVHEVQAFTKDASGMVQTAKRHFPKGKRLGKISHESRKPLDFSLNDITFPIDGNHSPTAQECSKELLEEEERTR